MMQIPENIIGNGEFLQTRAAIAAEIARDLPRKGKELGRVLRKLSSNSVVQAVEYTGRSFMEYAFRVENTTSETLQVLHKKLGLEFGADAAGKIMTSAKEVVEQAIARKIPTKKLVNSIAQRELWAPIIDVDASIGAFPSFKGRG